MTRHGAHGLSVYAPVTEGNTYEKCKCGHLMFARDSSWAEMLRQLHAPQAAEAAPAGPVSEASILRPNSSTSPHRSYNW